MPLFARAERVGVADTMSLEASSSAMKLASPKPRSSTTKTMMLGAPGAAAVVVASKDAGITSGDPLDSSAKTFPATPATVVREGRGQR